MKRTHLLGILSSVFLAVPATASAASMYDLSGFMDYTYTAIHDADPDQESDFDGNAELDLDANAMDGRVKGRIDVDLFLSDSNRDSADLEQAYAQWDIVKEMGLQVGTFNSGLGWEEEDAINLYQTSHGQLFDFFDAQTNLSGNNVIGAVGYAQFNAVDIRLGFLNDLGDAQDENSLMAQASAELVDGVNIEGSVVTQDGQAGNLFDINSSYQRGPLLVALELLAAEDNVNYGWGATGNYQIGNEFSVTGRFDSLDFDNASDTTSFTLAGIWQAMKNLELYLEYRLDDNGSTDNRLTLEALATFL